VSHQRWRELNIFEPGEKTTSIEISKGWQGGGCEEENLGKDLFYCPCCLVLGVHADTLAEGETEKQLGNIFTGRGLRNRVQ